MSYIKNDITHQLEPASLKLKEFHTFLNNVLFKYMRVNKNVYSYRQNRNIFDAVSCHRSNTNYFKTDIKNFFININKEIVLKYLTTNVNQYPMTRTIENYLVNIIDLVVYNNHLPVGFVASPSISNAVLYDFDNLIEDYCKKYDIVYSRYSDDLIFSSTDYRILKDLEKVIIKFLEDLYGSAFMLNKDKTEFLDKTNKVVLLGLVIKPDGHITVGKNLKENIKQLLYFYLHDKNKFKQFLELRYDNNIVKAYGSLNYINDIDKNFVSKLRKKYGNYIIDKFLHGNKRI